MLYSGFQTQFSLLNRPPTRPLHDLIIELCMMGVVVILVAVFLVSPSFIFLFISNPDPLYPLLAWLLPSSIVNNYGAFIIVRFILFTIVLVELFRCLTTYLLMALLMVVSVNDMSRRMAYMLSLTGITASRWRKLKTASNKVIQGLKIFNHIQIYFAMIETLYFWELPSVLFFGSILIIFGNYATIKLHSLLEIPLILLPPTTSIGVFIMMISLVPETADVFERSVNFLRQLKASTRSPYGKKAAGALKPYGLKSGPFFMMKNSMRKKLIEVQLLYTINLLLSM
jgi:hypothetical protein